MLEVYYPKQPHRRVFRIVASSEHAADSWVNTINEVIKMNEHFGTEAITMAGEADIEDEERSEGEE